MSANAATLTPATPWYRQAWPWFLISLPLAAVVAGIATLVLAIRSNDGLVTDDYYKQGLAINKMLARDEVAVQMGLQASILVQGRALTVTLAARDGVQLPESLRLSLVHPTRQEADQILTLSRQGNGGYVGTLAEDPQQIGRRTVLLEDLGMSWRLNGEAELGASAVTLKPQDESSHKPAAD